jgi:hypothetical protein
MRNETEKRVDGSLYRVYKHCTSAVLHWGIETWTSKFRHHSKKKGNKKSKGKHKKPGTLLLADSFEKFQQIAEAGVSMPERVYHDLEVAIKLREKASTFYRSVPSTSEPDLAGHEWIVQQLRAVRQSFKEGTHSAPKTETKKLERGFAALSTTDDHDDDETADREPVASREEQDHQERRQPRLRLQTADEEKVEDRRFQVACALVEISEARNDLRQRWKDWASRARTEEEND